MGSVAERKPSIGRVLLIDDEQGVRSALAAVLLDEFIVEAAESCADARTFLSMMHFDVVVTDFDMPAQDGLTFLDYLQSEHPATVGILLTGRADHAKVTDAQKNWARYRVLLKPIDPALLVATIRTCFHLARLRQSTVRLSSRLGR